MKYCDQCDKHFAIEEERCPVCGCELQEDENGQEPAQDETIVTMMTLGLL